MNRYPELQWTPERVSAFWKYESAFPQNYFSHQFGIEIAAKLAPFLPQRGTVLDYGCGDGSILEQLLRRGFSVMGTDFSDAALEKVNHRFQAGPGAGRQPFLGTFLGTRKIDELVRARQKFDAVICVEVVEHLSDSQLDTVFRHFRELLNPGGRLLVTTPNEERLEDSKVFCPNCENVFHRWQHVRTWSAASLKRVFEEHQLRPIALFATDFSASFRISPLRAAKALVKRALPGRFKQPHLVGVCAAS